jgi:two-component system chemotaxis response regulator CheB
MKQRLRVLVVDDSALMRKLIPQILERDPSIEVVGTAIDGSFGLKKIEDLKPQVVTLDLEMPGMNGIDMFEADHAATSGARHRGQFAQHRRCFDHNESAGPGRL